MGELDNLTILREEPEEGFQLSYRIVATSLNILIFIVGILGNMGLIVVVYKSKTLHNSGCAYLISLACADLLVIGTAVPEAIVSHQIGRLWILGQPGCAIFVFLNFLGINAGSVSLFAFTLERYIVVCRPLLAKKTCTLERTRKTIVLCWVIAIAYCAPWLGLTEVRRDPLSMDVEQCELRLTKEIYEVIFGVDLILFYIVPLVVAVVCQYKIGMVLRKRTRCFTSTPGLQVQREEDIADDQQETGYEHEHLQSHIVIYHCKSNQNPELSHRLQTQRLHMQVVIVVVFAVSWLPFRGLLLYNTFVNEPWLDLWYMLFAKTLVYLNCAINPFLYNVLCQNFRVAVSEIFSRDHPPTQHMQFGP